MSEGELIVCDVQIMHIAQSDKPVRIAEQAAPAKKGAKR